MRRIVVAGAVLALMGVQDLSPAQARTTGSASRPATSAAAVIAAPTPTPARVNTPTKVVALGDSITQSTGTGELSKENPKNSWATGWEVNSVAARLGIPTGNRFNLSKNGAEMDDIENQFVNGKSGGSGDVPKAPADTGLVLIQIGGNDLCADSLDAMTSETSYRNDLKSALARIKSIAPDTLVQIQSVPDIYNLWYIRGGPQNATYHPDLESNQAAGYNGARFYWGMSFFPCQSLLSNPDSYAQADRDRRAAVRTRDKAYNRILKEECAKYVRCHYDNDLLFNWSSNRVSGSEGPLLPQAQWRLTDYDISRNEGAGLALCPVQGVIAGGCGDHFHPSKQGQGKLADAAMASGFDWSDKTVPTATATVTSPVRPGGTYRGRATVHFGGTDDKGLRGQEVRIHKADGTVTPWTESIGIAKDVVISTVGTNYAEVRSFDINGNRSASKVLAVTVTPPEVPDAPAAPTIKGTSGGLQVSWKPPVDDGGADITYYELSYLMGAPGSTVGSTSVADTTMTGAPTPPPGNLVRYKVAGVNSVGEGVASSPSAPTIAPFGSLGTFVTQQYKDFAGRAPTSTELSSHVAKLGDGTETPAQFLEALMATPYWDGAYGPATRLYKAYFLRIPDPSGLDFWARQRRSGRTLDNISQEFAKSSEFKRRYGTLSDKAFLEQLYQNVFDRAPDSEGLDFYLRRLQAGWSRGRVVLQFSESSENVRKMAPTVGVVEVHRGMLGKAPTAAEVANFAPMFPSTGVRGLFTTFIADSRYAQRIVA